MQPPESKYFPPCMVKLFLRLPYVFVFGSGCCNPTEFDTVIFTFWIAAAFPWKMPVWHRHSIVTFDFFHPIFFYNFLLISGVDIQHVYPREKRQTKSEKKTV